MEKGFGRIGAILDQTSRAGKEAKVAIEIAVQDINNETNLPMVLYLQNSRSKPIHAAIAAKKLIDEHNVKAILGGHTWEETSAIAEIINESNHVIPVFLSLASTPPLQPIDQWPFFLQPVPTQSTQMNAVAAVLHSWNIRQVTLIYETSHLASASAAIISYLSQAFHQTGGELTHIVPLVSGLHSLSEELEVLKRQHHKVFVIHTSLELGINLFRTAKMMDMTGDGYLWIATNGITDLFHSVNPGKLSSLDCILGVKTYFAENTPEFLNFRKRFRQKFRSDYPEEDEDEPGIFAVQGYNTVRSLEQISLENSDHLRKIPATTVEVVYVMGKGYQSVYWTEGLGFSETVEDDNNGAITYTDSIDNIKQAIFPVQPWYAYRRRRNLAESSGNRMRVGVPGHSLFKQFVNVEFDPKKKQDVFNGFVIAVFDEMMKELKLPYDYFAYTGSYDELMKQIPAERFDAIAGDVTIMSSRHDYVDFTQPYTESGLEMIVPVRSRLSNQPWLFLKPYTAKMWWFIAAITLYNGFIIWLIERNHCEHLRGSVINQIGIIIWLASTTLFTLRGWDKLHSNLSRMAVIVWLFVALIITQSYTASLASMLTAQRLEPTISTVEALRNMNATVGYCNGSLVNHYLKDVLGFENFNVKSYNSTHRYAEALNSGEIAAIFLEVPSAKVFLAQYCKSFIRTGETFKVGGFGFLKELEDAYIISEKCVDNESFPNEDESLSPRSFSILLKLTGGTSTLAFAIYIFISFREFKESNPELRSVFELIPAFIKDQMRRSSGVVVPVESPTHPSNVSDSWP
ncbi:hypothetical protein E3N88_05410 [Mikania micrantha]|uniref:Ionotropic glutamate receptor C-terminal domain-containing protein n=1 Tax=Mikania micrantha TaxID=192012 RepID=A0A5N6PKV2_9ASTR|nr:hypothetical protein E3N88_05410 [Mikania micrantha]